MRFNQGVRSGDFAPMIDQFAEDAEMYFEGIPVGPFKGKSAIAKAYAEQPPDDEIIILNSRQGRRNDAIVGEYAWSKKSKVKAGEMEIEAVGESITKITIRYYR